MSRRGPVALAILLKEVTWFANRNLTHLIYGGVFERHPSLTVAFTGLTGDVYGAAQSAGSENVRTGRRSASSSWCVTCRRYL